MLPTIRAALALLCFDQQPSADVGTAILPTPKRQSRRGRFTLDEPARKRERERDERNSAERNDPCSDTCSRPDLSGETIHPASLKRVRYLDMAMLITRRLTRAIGDPCEIIQERGDPIMNLRCFRSADGTPHRSPDT